MKGKRTLRNTAQKVGDDPIRELIIMIGEGSSGILTQEAQGQRSFVESDTLPTDMGRHSNYDTKAILEAAGMKFLGVVECDDMFQYVELPQGWKKVATDHSMRSRLVDDKSRERASIFYKAAFYDRSANISLSCRFDVLFDYDCFDKENVGVANVTDGGKVIHTTEPISAAEGEKRWDVSGRASNAAVEWLNKNYPDWRNPGAYWD